LQSHSQSFLTLGTFRSSLRKVLKSAFGLHKFSSRATFGTWKHFLTLGLYGQTDAGEGSAGKTQNRFIIQAPHAGGFKAGSTQVLESNSFIINGLGSDI
jgi:hypothetical protein